MTTFVYCWNKICELIQNTLFMNVKKITIKYFAWKKKFSLCEGDLLNTLKLFSAKWKMHADFLVLYSINHIFVTRSVPKNIELVQKLFFMDDAKKNKKFGKKKNLCVQLDTFRHTKRFFWQNNLLLFFNIHEKCVLYQFKKFIITIHWCRQQNIIYSVKYFRIGNCKSFMRPRFFPTL